MQANPSAAGSKGCLMAVAISESQHLSSFSSHLNHFRQVTTGQEEHPWKNVNPESFIGVQVTHTKCRRYQSYSIITVRFHYIFAQVSCDTHRLPERGHRIWTSSFCPLPGCTLYIWSTRCHGVKGSFCSGWTKWTIWTKTSQVALKQIWLIAWSGFESNGWRLTKQVFWGCDSIVGCISHEEAVNNQVWQVQLLTCKARKPRLQKRIENTPSCQVWHDDGIRPSEVPLAMGHWAYSATALGPCQSSSCSPGEQGLRVGHLTTTLLDRVLNSTKRLHCHINVTNDSWPQNESKWNMIKNERPLHVNCHDCHVHLGTLAVNCAGWSTADQLRYGFLSRTCHKSILLLQQYHCLHQLQLAADLRSRKASESSFPCRLRNRVIEAVIAPDFWQSLLLPLRAAGGGKYGPTVTGCH